MDKKTITLKEKHFISLNFNYSNFADNSNCYLFEDIDKNNYLIEYDYGNSGRGIFVYSLFADANTLHNCFDNGVFHYKGVPQNPQDYVILISKKSLNNYMPYPSEKCDMCKKELSEKVYYHNINMYCEDCSKIISLDNLNVYSIVDNCFNKKDEMLHINKENCGKLLQELIGFSEKMKNDKYVFFNAYYLKDKKIIFYKKKIFMFNKSTKGYSINLLPYEDALDLETKANNAEAEYQAMQAFQRGGMDREQAIETYKSHTQSKVVNWK